MFVQGGDKVEKLLKGYTFRLYPTEEQKVLIEKSFGCSRYIYNYFLDKTNGRKYIKTFDYIKDLNNAEGFIKSILCKRKLPLRIIPELEFVYDDSIEYGMKIEKIIEETKEKEN